MEKGKGNTVDTDPEDSGQMYTDLFNSCNSCNS